MKEVTFYDTSTGAITRLAALNDDMVNVNCITGESWIEGYYDPASQKIENGEVVSISDDIINQRETEGALANLRQTRGLLLLETDWTQSPDSPLTDAKKTEWATYRQALRDLPANTTDPRNPTWPTKPT